jgi:hypothetical protein
MLIALMVLPFSAIGPFPLVARTAAIVGVEMACGDALEQRMQSSEWDKQRSFRFGATGFLATGPLAHTLFRGLERLAPGNTLQAVLAKVTGNAAFMPIMIGATLSTAWALEGAPLNIYR